MRFPEEQQPVLEACRQVQSLRSAHNIVTTLLLAAMVLGASMLAIALDVAAVATNDFMMYLGLMLVACACLARLISRWLIFGRAFKRRNREMYTLLATPAGQRFLANLDFLDDSGQGCSAYTGIREMTIHVTRTASRSQS